MAKWNFADNRDSFLANILVRAVSDLSPDVKDQFFAREKGSDYDIHLIVDGFEMPLVATFESIEKQLDDMIQREAVKLLDDKLNEHYHKLTDITCIIDNAYKQIRQDFAEKTWYHFAGE